MTGWLSENFHGVGIGPVSKIFSVKKPQTEVIHIFLGALLIGDRRFIYASSV
jgi:hypothetical protein